MSSNIDYSPEVPAVTDLRSVSNVVVNTGVTMTDYQIATSSNGVDSSSSSFEIQVPRGRILCPNITLRFPVKATVEIANLSAAAFALDKNWAFSNLAVHRFMDTVSVTINGSTISRKVSDLVHLYAPLADGSSQNPALSAMFPTPDFVSNYKDLAASDGPSIPFGNPKHYLNQYFTPRRNGDEVVSAASVAAGATSSVDISGTLHCTIPLEFFAYTGGAQGLAHVDKCYVACTFRNRPQELLKMMPADKVTINSVSMREFSSTPQCFYGFVDPCDVIKKEIAGAPQTYSYTEYRVQTTSLPTIPAGGSVAASTSSISLGCVPSKLVIFAIPVDETVVHNCVTRPHHYGVIESLTVSIGGQNVFAGMSSNDLYNMSCRNGLTYSYPMWLSCGAPVYIDLNAGDLGTLGAHIGEKTTDYISCKLTVKNTSDVAKAFRALVVSCEDSFLTLTPDASAAPSTGIRLPENIKESLFADLGEVIKRSHRYLGGGFWGDLWSGIKKYTPKVIRAIPEIFRVGKDVAGVVKNIRGGAPSVVGGATLYASGMGTLPDPMKPRILRKAGGIADPPAKSRIH